MSKRGGGGASPHSPWPQRCGGSLVLRSPANDKSALRAVCVLESGCRPRKSSLELTTPAVIQNRGCTQTLGREELDPGCCLPSPHSLRSGTWAQGTVTPPRAPGFACSGKWLDR